MDVIRFCWPDLGSKVFRIILASFGFSSMSWDDYTAPETILGYKVISRDPWAHALAFRNEQNLSGHIEKWVERYLGQK